MLTFAQFLTEGPRQKEEISWISHPHHGIHAEKGTHIHRQMLNKNDHLEKISSGGEDKDYSPATGYVHVDRPNGSLMYTKYHNPHSTDATELDRHIRKKFDVPAHFKSVLVGPDQKGWENHAGFKTVRYAA